MKIHRSFKQGNVARDTSLAVAALEKVDEVYLYGASTLTDARGTLTILTRLRDVLNWTVRFVDRNPDKQINGFEGMPVISPEMLYAVDKERALVVLCVSAKAREEVKTQLTRQGFTMDRNVFTDDRFVMEILPRYLSGEMGYDVDVYMEY